MVQWKYSMYLFTFYYIFQNHKECNSEVEGDKRKIFHGLSVVNISNPKSNRGYICRTILLQLELKVLSGVSVSFTNLETWLKIVLCKETQQDFCLKSRVGDFLKHILQYCLKWSSLTESKQIIFLLKPNNCNCLWSGQACKNYPIVLSSRFKLTGFWAISQTALSNHLPLLSIPVFAYKHHMSSAWSAWPGLKKT